MWRKPKRVTHFAARRLWQLLGEIGKVPTFSTAQNDPIGQALYEMYKLVTDLWKETYESPRRDFNEFDRRFMPLMIALVEKLEREERYDVFEEAYARSALCMLVEREHAETLMSILTVLVTCLHVLAGDESRMLVGTRGGRLVFKHIKHIAQRELDEYMQLTLACTSHLLRFVSEEDIALIPSFRTFNQPALDKLAKGLEYLDVNVRLMRDAFYNQRYILNPNGVYVKVSGAKQITGLHLRVRPSDDSLVELLARVETPGGDFFTVLEERRFIEDDETPAVHPSLGSYATHVISQVYNGLVTGRRIGDKSDRVKIKRDDGKVTGFLDWSLPVGGGDGDQKPRSVLPPPPDVEVSNVKGHPRNVPMTLAHQAVLEEFERQTGIPIISRLGSNQTFVRPHFTPALSPDEMKRLSRSVLFRLSRDIAKRITGLGPE